MARSESEESVSASNSKAKPIRGDPESEDDAGSEEGTEYEIEEVLDAKRGFFPDGRMGYFVKWKGYGPDDNSWVDEQDAINAQELVDEYWRKNPQKKGAPRKSIDKKTPKKARASAAPEDTSEADEAPSTKKRSRKSNIQIEDDEMDVDEVVEKPSKKAKTNTTKANKSKSKNRSPTPDAEPVFLPSMKEYMNLKSWEGLIKTVDTVERDKDELMVFFSLNTGEKAKQSSSVCKKYFPLKLLDFYESNLRWREAQDGDFE